MRAIVLLCGVFSLAFAIFHLFFWKIFKWDRELKKLSFANKGIMQILNGQIIYYFLFVAFICFTFCEELLASQLGRVFLMSCSLFWLLRAIQQFIFLRANYIQIHILTILFVSGAILFALPVLMR